MAKLNDCSVELIWRRDLQKTRITKGSRKTRKSPATRRQSERLYYIKSTPDKGMGMFASANIPAGTTIIREDPLLTVYSQPELVPDEWRVDLVQEFCDHFSQASKKAQEALLSFSHGSDELLREDLKRAAAAKMKNRNGILALRKYIANRFDLNDETAEDERDCTAVYEEITRANHSCLPNCCYDTKGNEDNIIILVASRNIPKDEEITVSYIDSVASRAERQEVLAGWGFTCNCTACDLTTGFGVRSDKRRTELEELLSTLNEAHEEYLETPTEENESDMLFMAQRIIQLREVEGLYQENLVRPYLIAANIHERRGEYKAALEMAQQGDRLYLCTTGYPRDGQKRINRLMERIRVGDESLSSQ